MAFEKGWLDRQFDNADKDMAELPSWLRQKQQDICPACGESEQLAKIKGCIRCLKCGFKEDCNGF